MPEQYIHNARKCKVLLYTKPVELVRRVGGINPRPPLICVITETSMFASRFRALCNTIQLFHRLHVDQAAATASRLNAQARVKFRVTRQCAEGGCSATRVRVQRGARELGGWGSIVRAAVLLPLGQPVERVASRDHRLQRRSNDLLHPLRPLRCMFTGPSVPWARASASVKPCGLGPPGPQPGLPCPGLLPPRLPGCASLRGRGASGSPETPDNPLGFVARASTHTDILKAVDGCWEVIHTDRRYLRR
mmetsp:Transcript_1238/g.2508  ORF Transcript_1238/g.2508 Transcript_1238/m.2508 type:complete len:248 (-) Transcript_1238:437-1180(-)